MSILTHAALDRIEASLARLDADPRAVLDAVVAERERDLSVTSYTVYTALWSAGMTLAFGPTGLHESWCDASGHPLPETIADPWVGGAMREARRRIVECYLPCGRREARS